jgi:hypothetical protein
MFIRHANAAKQSSSRSPKTRILHRCMLPILIATMMTTDGPINLEIQSISLGLCVSRAGGTSINPAETSPTSISAESFPIQNCIDTDTLVKVPKDVLSNHHGHCGFLHSRPHCSHDYRRSTRKTRRRHPSNQLRRSARCEPTGTPGLGHHCKYLRKTTDRNIFTLTVLSTAPTTALANPGTATYAPFPGPVRSSNGKAKRSAALSTAV